MQQEFVNGKTTNVNQYSVQNTIRKSIAYSIQDVCGMMMDVK
jgi:hypothetical protein